MPWLQMLCLIDLYSLLLASSYAFNDMLSVSLTKEKKNSLCQKRVASSGQHLAPEAMSGRIHSVDVDRHLSISLSHCLCPRGSPHPITLMSSPL